MRMAQKREEQRGSNRKTEKRWKGKSPRREDWSLACRSKQEGEQELQAGRPSTCCFATAKSNTLFQQRHCLMASVEGPLPGPWLPLQTHQSTCCADTHAEIHQGFLKVIHTRCLCRVTHPGARRHNFPTCVSSNHFYCTFAWIMDKSAHLSES